MGTNELQNLLTVLANGQHLTQEQAQRAFQIIMNGGATPGQIAAFMMGLRINGETVDEITAGAQVMRAKSHHIEAPAGAIDTCGTGGDMKRTLNISTAVAIVVAACGVPVAKHGNRGVSSASGSADVLRELGVGIEADPELAERCLKECNLCFLMAPKYHLAMRHVTPVRVELGLRTIFNLLGPLANPAGVKRQLLGVYDVKWVEPMAKVLLNLGAEHAWVVHGSDGADELSTSVPSFVCEVKDGEIQHFQVDPLELGIEAPDMQLLKGQDPSYNAAEIQKLLGGKKGPYWDIVLLNAAAALIVAGKAEKLEQGMALATSAIDSGTAKQTLAQLANLTNPVGKSHAS